jgi:hypothetical protein
MNDELTEPAPGATPPRGADLPIHEEFADPSGQPSVPAPSHRKGMLGGLAAVGALLAVLVLVAPGGSTPKLPPQVIRDVSPSATVASNKVPAPASSPTTAPDATGTTTTTTGVPQHATVMEASNAGGSTTRNVVTPASDRAASGAASGSSSATPTTSAPATTPTTSPPTTSPSPTTTPTTSPPPTTTPTTAPPPTTTTTSCVLGILCNG